MEKSKAQFPNPYDLLGVSPSSSLAELKKSYYNLSLICHPDRGGQSSDMTILHTSYKFLKTQFTKREENQYGYDFLEDQFQKFCHEQKEQPPKFADIYQETNDWINMFNQEFKNARQDEIENHSGFSSCFEDGYGEYMDQSTPKDNYSDLEDKQSVHQFVKEIQVYQEPVLLPIHYGNYQRYDVTKIDDFSDQVGDLQFTDYRKAFTPNDEFELFSSTSVEDTEGGCGGIKFEKPSQKEITDKYQDILQERAEVDDSFQSYYDLEFNQYQDVLSKLPEIRKKLANKFANDFLKEIKDVDILKKWYPYLGQLLFYEKVSDLDFDNDEYVLVENIYE